VTWQRAVSSALLSALVGGAGLTVTQTRLAARVFGQQSSPQEVALQAAIRTEILGDLEAAIRQYDELFNRYRTTDRAVAAMALARMAECRRRFGDPAAQPLFQRVLDEFSDQAEAVRLARSRLQPAAPELPAVRPVWSLSPDATLASSISWDGRRLGYVDWSTAGAADLFVRDLRSGTSRRLTRTGNTEGSWSRFPGGAAISRDGSRIAYEWNEAEDVTLRVLPVARPAERPRVLVAANTLRHISPQDWSADGQWIAAWWTRADNRREIGLISTVDGSLRPLAPIDRACACESRVALSPDGSYLAFHLPGAGTRTRDIFVVPAAGGAVQTLVEYRGDDELIGWTPDGRGVVFKSDRSGATGFWLAPFKAGAAGQPKELKRDVGTFVPVGTTASGAIHGCRCEQTGGSDIKHASLDFSTGRVLDPPVDAVQEFVGTNSQPFWSNDGTMFVYRSLRPNQDPILVLRSAGTLEVVRELRPRLYQLIDPRWSPDDRSIVVLGRDFENRFGYYRVDVSTGLATALVTFGAGSNIGAMSPEASWSPDGSKFYYRRRVSTEPHEALMVELDVATGQERVLVRQPGQTGHIPATLSPDGRQLYYREPTGAGPLAIVVLDLESGTRRQVFQAARIGGFSRSPDGRTLAVTIEPAAGEPGSLVLVPEAGGDARTIWRFVGEEPIATQSAGAWARDGRSLVTRRMAGPNRPQLWWLAIDGSGQRQLTEFNDLVPQGLRVHPDGTRVLFGATVAGDPPPSPSTEVWVWDRLLAAAAR
jgi:Tol biopolymer transport system component